MLVPYEIPSVVKTNIMEVFPYVEDEEANANLPVNSDDEEEEMEMTEEAI